MSARFRFSIRNQLLLPFLLLLIFPVTGYFWIDDWTMLLEQTERNSLLTSASNIAGRLQEKQQLLSTMPEAVPLFPGRDLYSHKLRTDITLDGRKQDWQALSNNAEKYDKSNLVNISYPYTSDSLTYALMLGSNDTHLYVFLEIKDDSVVYREINNLSIHRNDHIQLALRDSEDVYRRYTIAAYQPTRITAHVVTASGRSLRQEAQISGTWLATESGYNVEFKIPLPMIGKHLALAVADVDDPDTREIKFIMGSADARIANGLGTILIPSVAIDDFFTGLTSASVWLLDVHQRVITRTGSIKSGTEIRTGSQFLTGVEFLDRLVLREDFPLLTPRDKPERTYIESALAGHPVTGLVEANQELRPGSRKIIIAATPVFNGDEIVAVIVRDQTNDAILTIRNQMLVKMLMHSLLLFTVGLICWLLFSSSITNRLRQLRSELESAVDSQGRVNRLMSTVPAKDEIGDLRSSFSEVASRLQQYNQYLEAMAGRLAHELRTPVSIVRSSLENLEGNALSDESTVYVKRAHKGVHRLTNILNNMSEATRLEQSLDDDEIEKFDLANLVRGCVSGYEQAFADNAFNISIEADSVMLTGIPDLIAQLLDKLVNNAIEFSNTGNPIKIRLTVEGDDALLRVINDGPGLPLEMRDKLFDSMISVRRDYDNDSTHLGLGLYIAKIITDFHGGTITASNREDTSGVIITLKIPLMRLSIKL